MHDPSLHAPGIHVPMDVGLLQAYLAARYEVRLAEGWIRLQVGQRVPRLETALPAPAYALVSAWNPAPVRCTGARNRRADADLCRRLDALRLPRRRSRSSDAYGQWHEEGWLVAGLAPAQADRLARCFGQAAILHWHAGQPVGMRLYLPPPTDPAPPPWVVAA